MLIGGDDKLVEGIDTGNFYKVIHKTKYKKERKMKKKVSTILMFTAVFTMAAMFGAIGVTAGDRPLECTDGTYTVTPVAGEFPRFQPAGEECGDSSGWLWEYNISAATRKQMSALTKLHVYIPSLPPNTIEAIGEHVALRGEGGVSTPFGDGNYNGIVVSVTPLAGGSCTERTFSFCTKDVNSTGTVSVVFDTARRETGCAALDVDESQGPLGGIIGPGTDPSSFVVAEEERTINLGDFGSICVKKHPETGCIKYFYGCEDGTPIVPQAGPPEWLSGQVLDMGSIDNPICREAVIARKGSPLAYWGYANGNYYCLGIYDTGRSPYWFSPCSSY